MKRTVITLGVGCLIGLGILFGIPVLQDMKQQAEQKTEQTKTEPKTEQPENNPKTESKAKNEKPKQVLVFISEKHGFEIWAEPGRSLSTGRTNTSTCTPRRTA